MPSKNTIKRRQQAGIVNRTKIEGYCILNDIDVSNIQDYHMRLSADDKPTIDVFPNTCKTHHIEMDIWLDHKEWDKLEQYLNLNYVDSYGE